MLITHGTLKTLYTGFKTSFQQGLGQHESQWPTVAMKVNSTTRTEEYGWLGKIPGVREWLGDRVVHGLQGHGYAIRNKNHELTVGVSRDDIEDDNLGIYAPMFTEMGRSVGAYPDEQVWGLLANGFSTPCYDGQPLFDADHPVLDADGAVQSVANTDAEAGTGEPWFLLDLSRAIKPVIYQERKAFQFVSMTKETDENVFKRNEFLYGADGRSNVGFGLWQLAWGSKKTLDKAAYKAARQWMMGQKGDHGRPLGLRPTHLVVPPNLEGAALEILNAERDTAGATNVYKGTAQLLVVPWLA
ncbi:Mu-like prophage major head subunit gpT family protein [Roseospirillum parvum]|uniref:Mu-like prophage major head subunit gpT n=1 Tax=Roseospirillum parvum TaxID=83401 RepID=A0A1G8GBQ7_9PROT|nr:Mu-like prophage major head subunit gpT family protein [Roseospirillum parvum]SDH91852.1 Mu-like prophage major head subunit gpT [Roseospirillum parvum]